MKSFKILRYLKKLLPVIIVFCLLATYAINYKLKASNTYVASEVIYYNDDRAEKGIAPTGDKLDVNEIKSSAVMSKVVDKMELTGVYSVDSLISRISITPIEDKDKVHRRMQSLRKAKNIFTNPGNSSFPLRQQVPKDPALQEQYLMKRLMFILNSSV